MARDVFYKSEKWKHLRAAALKRSNCKCEVPGCGNVGKVVDHVVARRAGGRDVLDNLRVLCRDHDNQVKEDQDGNRRSDGRLVVRGCDANGFPLDPNHEWNSGRGDRSSGPDGAGDRLGHDSAVSSDGQ